MTHYKYTRRQVINICREEQDSWKTFEDLLLATSEPKKECGFALNELFEEVDIGFIEKHLEDLLATKQPKNSLNRDKIEAIKDGESVARIIDRTDEITEKEMTKPNGWEQKVYQWFHDQDIRIHSDRVQPLLETISQTILSAEERAREECKEMVFGELNRSELQAVVSSMGRLFGHTYSAVNGVKNNKNSKLVIVHRHQESNIDLPKEQLITLEDIKMGKIRGRKTALVMDNYAVEEVNRDIKERMKRGFESLSLPDQEQLSNSKTE